MPERLRDPQFEEHFRVEVDEIDQGRATASCKACPASWDVLLGQNGCVHLGARNALLAHAAKHSPNYKPVARRRS